MKQQEVFKKIGGIIKELNDQYEYLKTIDGPLNELELELFLANSHFLVDHVLILSKLNAQAQVAAKPVVKTEAPYEQTYFEPLVRTATQEPKTKPEEISKPVADYSAADENPTPSIDLETGSLEDSYSYERDEEPETIRHELILDEADWDDEEEPYENKQADIVAEGDEIEMPPAPPRELMVAEAPEQQPLVEEEKAPEPVAELIIAEEQKPEPAVAFTPEPVAPAAPARETAKDDVLTINERLAAKNNRVAEQLQPQSISDLKQAINLNDKLLFVKDLFNGYSLAYSEAIEILNRFNSFDEADLFLRKNYVVKNNWEAKPDTTEKLYALLKRRYA